MKESSGGGDFKWDILDTFVRTFVSVNATMYPHPAQ
jgi:hypothetical protein